MQDIGVIEKVNGPTDWVSSIVIVGKPNGDVRICLDPKKLNDAIIREYHYTQKLEEVLSQVSDAKVFNKLDARSGYWNVVLDEESKFLRTAARKNRESSVNDHFSGSLIFCPEIPFSELFSKNIFTSFSDSCFFGNLREFENAVFVRFSIDKLSKICCENQATAVLKILELKPNLIRHKNNHFYPFLP